MPKNDPRRVYTLNKELDWFKPGSRIVRDTKLASSLSVSNVRDDGPQGDAICLKMIRAEYSPIMSDLMSFRRQNRSDPIKMAAKIGARQNVMLHYFAHRALIELHPIQWDASNRR